MIKSWILAARPKTLSASLLPVSLATALAHQRDWTVFTLTLFAAICIQVGTNLVNDAKDFEKGADTSDRIGPLRVTQSGLLSAAKVMQGALFFFTLASFAFIPLILKGGWPIAIVMSASILSGYAYTSGPKPLAYAGLGDLFVLIFFGWVATCSVYYLHTATVTVESFVAGTIAGLLSTVLIGINNLRDVKSDQKAGKKTVVVRFGVGFGKALATASIFIPYFLLLYWKDLKPLATVLPYITLPFAFFLAKKIVEEAPSPKYNQFLMFGAILQIAFGFCLIAGLV